MNTIPPDSAIPPAAYPPAQPDAGAIPAHNAERRAADRRREPTRISGAFPLAGRRMKNRRAAEHSRPYFVDRFSSGMLLCVLLLVLASLIDAVLTLHLLAAGGEEVNPLMDCLLNHSIEAFLIGKYLLTVVGLPLLLIFKNHYLFGTRLRIGYLIPAAVALYIVLIAYQITLVRQYLI